MMETVNLLAALDAVTEHWSPKVVSRVNDQYVKVAKLLGQLVWHKHDEADELFQVIRGQLSIEFEGGHIVDVGPGELCVVPKGVMHNPVAADECWIVLIETVTTRHTGDVVLAQTRSIEAQLT